MSKASKTYLSMKKSTAKDAQDSCDRDVSEKQRLVSTVTSQIKTENKGKKHPPPQYLPFPAR
jgi:hypothetical protein